MRKNDNFSGIIHVSKTNKKLIDTACRDEYLIYHPDMKEVKITQNLIMSSMIKYYLGKDYEKFRSEAENEHKHRN